MTASDDPAKADDVTKADDVAPADLRRRPDAATRPDGARPADIPTVAARYWDEFTEAHPVAATAFGDRRHDDRLDNLTEAARARHGRALRRLLLEARAAVPAAADDAERVTASALINQIELDLAALEADLDPWTVDPIEGPQIAILNIESFQRVATPADGGAMVARWRAMGPM